QESIVVPPASRTSGASSSPKDSTPRATSLALTVVLGSRPLAVPERLDDLAVPHSHEIHSPVVLGARDPPADDGAVDLELDRGVAGQSLPAGEAFVVLRPDGAGGGSG